MILPDTNILIYAVDAASPRHDPARIWLEDRLSGAETVALAWPVLTAFLKLATHPAVFYEPLTPTQAFDLIAGWLAQAPVIVIHPGDRHEAVLRELLEPLGTAGNLVPDAHLAALAIEHGATLASCDHDFARFPRLRWQVAGVLTRRAVASLSPRRVSWLPPPQRAQVARRHRRVGRVSLLGPELLRVGVA